MAAKKAANFASSLNAPLVPASMSADAAADSADAVTPPDSRTAAETEAAVAEAAIGGYGASPYDYVQGC